MTKKVQPHMVPFFERFAKNIITNTVLIQLSEAGNTITDDLSQTVQEAVNGQDVSSLTEAVGVALLERVEYKTLVKVEKFLVSEDARQAMTAAQEVGNLVQQEVFDLIEVLLAKPKEESV
jgi:phage-related baseplate assembly protein